MGSQIATAWRAVWRGGRRWRRVKRRFSPKKKKRKVRKKAGNKLERDQRGSEWSETVWRRTVGRGRTDG